MKKLIISVGLTFAAMSCAIAAPQLPQDLIGKWATTSCKESAQAEKATGQWTGVKITKIAIQEGRWQCTPISVKGSSGKYAISQTCTPPGDEPFKTTRNYEVKGERLITSGKGAPAYSYVRCTK